MAKNHTTWVSHRSLGNGNAAHHFRCSCGAMGRSTLSSARAAVMAQEHKRRQR